MCNVEGASFLRREVGLRTIALAHVLSCMCFEKMNEAEGASLGYQRSGTLAMVVTRLPSYAHRSRSTSGA